MREGEPLKTYSDRYWEMFNEINGDYDDVAISTFKVGLSAEHDLRKSLIGKLVTSVRQLMDQIDKYRKVEEDQLQGKGKVKPRSANTQVVNAVFRKPVQQDYGHTTKDCRNLWDHLDQLVREGKLRQLLHHSSGQGSQTGSKFRGDASSRLPLGTINVIFVAPGRTRSCPSRVMSVSLYPAEESSLMPKRVKMGIPLVLGFSNEDKFGTIQPHDYALVVTLRVGGYDMKMVMID
ncbi:uncharacterized protein LOC115991410 [Quercus lobata]|uniref:uncharacterized protein LOC115991410 n=1 Tax=Quercus lobata TaxID=97700 RepID=UPI0012476708|nr:uncharacterized protein LOC115991410 [Quercus lobata]